MNRLQNINHSLSFPQIYDYIIVGGGISGLQSAEILSLKTKNILIIEAQEKLGGRIASLSVTDLAPSKSVDWVLSQQEHFKKCKIQKGATWIQQRHVVLRQFCRLNNIPMKLQYNEGSPTYLADKAYTNKELLASHVYGPQIKKFLFEIDNLAEEYRKNVLDAKQVNQTYKKMLKKYDSMTVEEYLKSTISTKAVRDLIECFLEHTQCISADVNSMHEVLAKHSRSNDVGILKQFLGVEEHQPSYLIEGTEIVIEKYIQSVQKNIRKGISQIVNFESQVIEIDNTQPNLCIVTCLQKSNKPVKVYGKKVICAAPLLVLRNINFTNISENKRIVFDNQLRTNAIKTFVVMRKPFWRNQNHSGDGLFSYDWMVNMCHDISPEDQSCGIIVFFHNGKKYYQWKSMFSPDPVKNYEERRKYMINVVANMFGVKQGSKQFQQHFNDCFIGQSGFMQNPYIRSGFQSNTRPGTFTRVLQRGGELSALYGDEHNVLFIGSQFSDSFASYIEGALRVSRKKMFKLIGEEDPMKKFMESVNVVTKH